MNKWIGLLLYAMLLSCTSTKHSHDQTKCTFEGVWIGSITDMHATVDVELALFREHESQKGTFTILNAPEYDAPLIFGIARIVVDKKSITFIVPVSGNVDDEDALKVKLSKQGEYLEGYLQEMREGSPEIPCKFQKK